MTDTPTLRGSLSDLRIEDVVHLLDARRHSGVLLVNPPQPQWLVLAEGSVVFGGSTSPLALGRHLLATGDVTAEGLEALFGLVEQGRTEPRQRSLDEAEVIEALSHNVAEPVLVQAVGRQAVGVLFEMMMFGDVEMEFTAGPPHPLASRFGVPLLDVAAAAAQRVEAWPQLVARLGHDGSHLRRVRRIAAQHGTVSLTPLEWAAVSEIDERATIGQIAHRLGHGRADTYAVLVDLMDRGLVEPAG